MTSSVILSLFVIHLPVAQRLKTVPPAARKRGDHKRSEVVGSREARRLKLWATGRS